MTWDAMDEAERELGCEPGELAGTFDAYGYEEEDDGYEEEEDT